MLKEKFDLIFYTGNDTVGKIIMAEAAKTLTPCVFELGGKSPVIVDDNVDVDVCAKRIMWGKIMNNGQTCVAPDYVLVHRNIATQLVEALKRSIPELIPGNLSTNPSYSRISCLRHFQRLRKLLEDQLNVPGTYLAAGGKFDESDLFLEPTILTGVGLDPNTNPIMKSEIFGPILAVIEYDNIDEAISYVNSK